MGWVDYIITSSSSTLCSTVNQRERERAREKGENIITHNTYSK